MKILEAMDDAYASHSTKVYFQKSDSALAVQIMSQAIATSICFLLIIGSFCFSSHLSSTVIALCNIVEWISISIISAIHVLRPSKEKVREIIEPDVRKKA